MALTVLLLLATTMAANSHTEASPRRLTPGSQVRIVITATPERAPFRNERLTTIVPRQFEVLTCIGPDGWVCGVDRDSFTPHVLVAWESVGTAEDDALDFEVNVLVPTEAGAYLLRALQTHADGYVEPWVYNEEPFPSALVIVGEDTRLVNPDGSAEDPPCYGPSYQPSYEEHDGSEVEDGCDRSKPAPDPSTGPRPSPSPSPTVTARPSAEPSATASPSAPTTSRPSEGPTDAPSPSPTQTSAPSTAPTGSDGPDVQATEPEAGTASEAAPRAPAISVEDLDRPRDRDGATRSPALLVGGLALLTGIGSVARRELRRRAPDDA